MIEFYCPRWGSADEDWKSFFVKAINAGYHGVEIGISRNDTHGGIESIWNLAEQHGAKIIVQHYDTVESGFNEHYDLYCRWLEKVKPFAVRAARINTQTGKDFFSFEQNSQLITAASAIKNLSHETHRNKFSFAAHVTKEYLERIQDLRLTLDLSHWVNVAESYLQDQPSAVDLAIERTDHLHARVGYPEGPQVPDPRIAEWREALNFHLNWWDKLVFIKRQQNEVLTITPEFGPYPYMINMPSTGVPIASQWDINVWMMNLLKERYTQ